jgi:hypothetical protein
MQRRDQEPEHTPLRPNAQTREQSIRETEYSLGPHQTGGDEF